MPRTQYESSIFEKDVGALGFVEGLRLSHKGKPVLDYYGGVPYALPPVGPFRFKRPRQLAPCYRYGHQGNPGRFTGRTGLCPQPGFRGPAKESLWDENCLQLNIYTPAGTPPKRGWAVLFYIHGGWLQFGSANEKPEAMARLISETAFNCILVVPAYRLNAFGFLASHELAEEAQRLKEPVGNYGFWDQRLALEWTWKNITLFGGDHSRITVAGYSAGAHSAFQQLSHELYFVPDDKAIIKGVIMWSNSPGVQPKSLDEQQHQFDELVRALGVPDTATSSEKLMRLRKASAEEIIKAQEMLKLTEFRATSDGLFISKQSITNVVNGDFGQRMKRRGIRLMSGEDQDEHHLYRQWRTPQPSYDAVFARLCSDYPEAAVKRLLPHYCTNKQLPAHIKDWQHLFGMVYADMQVHSLQRGFHDALFRSGLKPGEDVFRYRFNKRMKCVDNSFPVEWGVTHSTDLVIWFWGQDYDEGLTEQEKSELQGWNQAFAAFVKGEKVEWGTSKSQEMRRLCEDGRTDIWMDDRWSEGLELWQLLNGNINSPRAKL